ncbi:MAG: hypothetical protein IPN91_14195 [Holophagaceae bacterium]|uniref:Uncharacterized protein n=1 Tax=Candidatus Geothrix odensensis TaxID=2954440 RepID=A0A936F4Q2_9BACT|nr:hypothetical protein [Candidatus Geothrix odensensis]
MEPGVLIIRKKIDGKEVTEERIGIPKVEQDGDHHHPQAGRRRDGREAGEGAPEPGDPATERHLDLREPGRRGPEPRGRAKALQQALKSLQKRLDAPAAGHRRTPKPPPPPGVPNQARRLRPTAMPLRHHPHRHRLLTHRLRPPRHLHRPHLLHRQNDPRR